MGTKKRGEENKKKDIKLLKVGRKRTIKRRKKEKREEKQEIKKNEIRGGKMERK